MKSFQKANNLAGWIVFAIASTVYLLTIEPTASFWDCGEFIATAFKLEVGHPPGAPLFLILGRIVSLFAGNDLSKVPVMINALSAIASGFTILFLFWTITHFARKLLAPDGNFQPAKIILILGSGAVGAMAYTFSDSFWFSAVEGEVYASSSFFTAIVVWAMLKWENAADEKHANRWLILIAYLMGLSIGVHLLNLLAIPSLAFIYYFRKYKPSTKGIILTAIIGMLILGLVQAGVIPWVVILGSYFDLFFVNTLRLPFGSGIIVYAILVITGITAGLYYTRQKNKPLWNTVILCVTFIIIGYSSFAQILIRSAANPPMDENNPENPFTLRSYLDREQYGDRPLLYGQYYTAKYIDQEEGAMTFRVRSDDEKRVLKEKYENKLISKSEYEELIKDQYIEAGRKTIPVYNPEDCTIFPRMFSSQGSHVNAYKEWAGIKGDKTPTFAQNLKFFFAYQVNWMYWRYFMWNFTGRQNDVQGHGNITDGNWISGIPFIDKIFLGPQDKIPPSMTKNKAMNKFYFLPFILGMIGLVYHFSRNKKDSLVVLLLFFFTGLAIVLYLNQTPYQPRERDYAYAGSFYAYAMWIGLGVLAVADFISKKIKISVIASAGIAILLCSSVPFVMGKDGWNDHNRSGRRTSRDFAYDYLNSCAPNAILFTNGDNDTFPLWYAQEVEGIRTDVRVVNLSLLNTDWYIDQMKRKAYDSDPVPFSLTSDKYVQGTRDYIPFYDKKIKDYVPLSDLIDFIGSENPQAKVRTQGGNELNFYPAKKFSIPVDSATVVNNGTVPKDLAGQVVNAVEWEIDKNYLMKADIMILDLLAHNNWKRPVYFAITVGNDSYMNLEDYFQLEGLAYRLVPIKSKTKDGQTGRIYSDITYKNLMEKFKWGGMDNPKVYLDENNLRMTMNFRNNFARLAYTLLGEGKKDSATKVLDRCVEVMPESTVPYNIFMLRIAEMYYRAGAIEKANKIARRLAEVYEQDLNYYFTLKGKFLKSVERDLQQAMAVENELLRISKEARQQELAADIEARVKKLQEAYLGSGAANTEE